MLIVLGMFGTLAVHAQSLESVLAPGKLIQGHAKWDDECKACHVRFDRQAQNGLCMDCHKDVGHDVRSRAGFHGRTPAQPCRGCHTEHKGREARIAAFDARRFDHAQTDFALRGKHQATDCAKCHEPGRKFSASASECSACHRKDDEGAKGHKGQFGEKCESCHTARAWKPSTFNHDTDTKYPLRFKHRGAKCADCHTGPVSKVKPATECYACHRKDDKHKESLGRDCGSCHTERDWKEKAKFDHERTAFPLLGRHAEVRCDACHKSAIFKEAPKACIGCHRQDDRHAATLGENCGACHVERDWKTTKGRFDHDRTRFALRNAHAAPKVQCKDCHADPKHFRSTPLDCQSCHRKDDRHEGQQGAQCASCHDDRSWKVASFDHARTRFPLVGRHIATACKGCHATPRFTDAARECHACHQKDDRHKLAFGVQCDSCHNARAWTLWDFDHDRRSRFKLDGAHRATACSACHTRPAAPGRGIAALPGDCLSCHRKDDTHDGAFGSRCEQCHATDRWKNVSGRMQRGGRAADERKGGSP